MIDLLERTSVTAPVTYQEWLDCLAILKGTSVYSSGIYEALIGGSFDGTDVTKTALQRQIVDSINALLDNSAKRFIKNMIGIKDGLVPNVMHSMLLSILAIQCFSISWSVSFGCSVLIYMLVYIIVNGSSVSLWCAI